MIFAAAIRKLDALLIALAGRSSPCPISPAAGATPAHVSGPRPARQTIGRPFKFALRAAIGALVVGLPACAQPVPDSIKPLVAIVTPAEGARYKVGESVAITVAAAASRNVARIELSVAGRIVATAVNPERSPTFSTRIVYAPATPGRVQLSVVAVDEAGISSDPFTTFIIIGDDAAAATPAAAGAAPPGCVLAATFLQDVTVPDGTVINPGTPFTKTWRMKNTSSCDWGEGFTIAFVGDTPMHPTGSAPVPPTPSNAFVDISVTLIAPTQSGVYTSTWRLKDPNNQFFGNRVFVVIRVP